MAHPAAPPSFVFGNPSDDPGCDLHAKLYVPDPLVFGTGPFPGLVMHKSAGLQLGGGESTNDCGVFMAANGWIAMYAEQRTMKGVVDGVGGAGIDGQTTDGRFDQQNTDHELSVTYLRNHALCNGFVGGYGGSGGGFLELYNACTAVEDSTRLDAAVSLSGVTDFSDRDTGNTNFIAIGTSYNNNLSPHGDLTGLLAQSPCGLASLDMPPLYFANGEHESMPFTQYTRFKAVLDGLGFTNYVSHINTDSGGIKHAFATFPENQDAILVFLNNAHAAWNGGSGGGLKPIPTGLYNLLPAPDGNIGDISIKPFLNNASIDGCRVRTRWSLFQPTSLSITGVAATNVITSAAHGYSNGDALTLIAVTGGAGITANAVYYVVSVTTDTFKLALTVGGAEINFTTDISAGKVAVFDWSQLDTALAVCAAKGKKMGVSINVNTGAPEWVYTDGTACTRFDISADGRDNDELDHMPLPWQPGFTAKFDVFVQAFGDRYDSHPFISYVNITGMAQVVELHFVKTQTDYDAASVVALLNGKASLEAGWQEGAQHCLDKYFTAFPTTQLFLNEGNPFTNTTGSNSGSEDTLIAHGELNGVQFGNFASFLHATLPPHDTPVVDPLTKGRQPIHQSSYLPGIYNDPQPDPYPPFVTAFEDCLLNGWSIGCDVIEVYEGDVSNPATDYQAVLANLHALLVPNPPPPPEAPVITEFSPTEGEVGATVVINGAHFTGVTSVLFNGAAASFTFVTDTNVTAIVPESALTGPITIVTPFGSDTSTNLFTVNEAEPGSFEAPVRSPILLYPKGGRPPGRRTVPGAPTNLSVAVSGVNGDNTAIASWLPPISDGNSPLTGYYAYVLGGTGTFGMISADATQVAITGLPFDETLTFHLAAKNKYGTGPEGDAFQFISNPDEGGVIPPDPDSAPRGFFEVLGSIDSFPLWSGAPFATAGFMAGATYEVKWSLMEPTAPVGSVHTIDFTDLDGFLDLCELHDKLAILSFATGVYAPDWHKDEAGPGNQFTTDGPLIGTMVFPWNQKAVQRWDDFIKAVGAHCDGRTCISAVTTGNAGQAVESIMCSTIDKGSSLNTKATKGGRYTSAGDAWVQSVEKAVTSAESSFNLDAINTITCLEFPIPLDTPLMDGAAALDALALTTIAGNRLTVGFMARGFSSISADGTKKFQLVHNRSGDSHPAGFRLVADSTEAALDPTQSPDSYDPLTGLVNALDNVVVMKGKFVEISTAEVNNAVLDSDFSDAIEAATTAMAALD